MPTDDLDAQRWFRQQLAWLARRYPHLQQPAHQERLSEELTRQAEEEHAHALHPDRQTRRTSQDERVQDDLLEDTPGPP